jgi:hypothetical protein
MIMRLRSILFLAVLLVGILASVPAWARPCCSDCPSWPDLDPYTDSCARVCDPNCFASQSLHFPKLAAAVSTPDTASAKLQQIFAQPGQEAPAPVCQ